MTIGLSLGISTPSRRGIFQLQIPNFKERKNQKAIRPPGISFSVLGFFGSLIFPSGLSLPLFVPGIGTNDVHPTFAPHDFAVLANPFDAGSNFHGFRMCLGRWH